MLEYSTSAPGPRLGLIVHHDDGEREYAYDRKSSIGRLERGLDEAGAARLGGREHEERLAPGVRRRAKVTPGPVLNANGPSRGPFADCASG